MKKNLTIILLFFCCTQIFAQISAYHGILAPYGNDHYFARTIGSITSAAPDFSSDLQNPAGLAACTSPQLLISTTLDKSDYKLTRYSTEDASTFSETGLENASLSSSYAVQLFNKKTVMALSVNKRNRL